MLKQKNSTSQKKPPTMCSVLVVPEQGIFEDLFPLIISLHNSVVACLKEGGGVTIGNFSLLASFSLELPFLWMKLLSIFKKSAQPCCAGLWYMYE